MKIVGVDIYAVQLELFRKFVVSRGHIDRYHIYVRLRTDTGAAGWGESGHLPPEYSGEHWQAAMVYAEQLCPIVLGLSPYDVGVMHSRFEAALKGNSLVKCAFDLAMHDLMAQDAGVPLHRLFGGAQVNELETQLDISVGTLDEVVADVQRAVDLGVNAVGLKVGPPASPSIKADVETVRVVRETFGPDLIIWIDCNSAYSRGAAVRAIRGMEVYDIGLVEQPVAGSDLEGMAYVASRVESEIVADESAWDGRDVYRIASSKSASVIHAKVPKTAGLYGLRKVASVCEAVGLPLTVACLAMGDFGQAALMHFLSAHPICHNYVHKLRGGGLFYKEDVVRDRLVMKNGRFGVPQIPGIGMEVDEEALLAKTAATKSIVAKL